MNKKNLIWLGVAIAGAVALGIVALTRGETINAAWLVVAAVCTYLIAYRYYGLFIAERVLRSSRSPSVLSWCGPR
jgi:carbon starvation protein